TRKTRGTAPAPKSRMKSRLKRVTEKSKQPSDRPTRLNAFIELLMPEIIMPRLMRLTDRRGVAPFRSRARNDPACYDRGSSSRRIMPRSPQLPVILLAAASAAVPLLAHHLVAAKFDKSVTLTLRGVVSRIEWMNPHARFRLDTTEDNGPTTWEFELPA